MKIFSSTSGKDLDIKSTSGDVESKIETYLNRNFSKVSKSSKGDFVIKSGKLEGIPDLLDFLRNEVGYPWGAYLGNIEGYPSDGCIIVTNKK